MNQILNRDRERKRWQPEYDTRRYRQLRRLIFVWRCVNEISNPTAISIQKYLREEIGYDVHIKTVRRDLHALWEMAVVDRENVASENLIGKLEKVVPLSKIVDFSNA